MRFMRLIIPHAVNAIKTPIRIVIIYFLAASVFSSLPCDMMYIRPTTQIPSTAMIAATSCSLPTAHLSMSMKVLAFSPGSPVDPSSMAASFFPHVHKTITYANNQRVSHMIASFIIPFHASVWFGFAHPNTI